MVEPIQFRDHKPKSAPINFGSKLRSHILNLSPVDVADQASDAVAERPFSDDVMILPGADIAHADPFAGGVDTDSGMPSDVAP